MTARERQGLRLGLLVIILMSVALAMVAWSPWPLGGMILPLVILWFIQPRGTRKPRGR